MSEVGILSLSDGTKWNIVGEILVDADLLPSLQVMDLEYWFRVKDRRTGCLRRTFRSNFLEGAGVGHLYLHRVAGLWSELKRLGFSPSDFPSDVPTLFLAMQKLPPWDYLSEDILDCRSSNLCRFTQQVSRWRGLRPKKAKVDFSKLERVSDALGGDTSESPYRPPVVEDLTEHTHDKQQAVWDILAKSDGPTQPPQSLTPDELAKLPPELREGLGGH